MFTTNMSIATRHDGHTYIDEAVHTEGRSTHSSGSSIAEEEQSEAEHEDGRAQSESPGVADVSARWQDFAYLDARKPVEGDSSDSEDEYDIDDEDWEFADGGNSSTLNRR